MIASLTEQQKHILKHPNYIGHLSNFMPYYRKFPSLNELHFTKIPHTIVTCTSCHGQRIKHYSFHGHLISQKCGICKGTGTMEIDNREPNKEARQ